MTASRRIYIVTAAFLISLLTLLAAHQVGANDWQDAVDPALLADLNDSTELEFIVRLRRQADLSQASGYSSKTAKGAFVYNMLRATAESTQSDLLADLASREVQYQSFWIINAVKVRADVTTLRDLARRSDVEFIFANSAIALAPPSPVEDAADLNSTDAIEWNVQLIGAPELWSLSADGRDVVIAGQDTGYQWDHPALKSQYRGWNGTDVLHDYNWHDAIDENNQECQGQSPVPCDDHGHGTHTMGTMVGDDGADNQIGVAPGARWIGCRNMNNGIGTPSTYIDCFQWFIAPTEIGGGNPDPARAPDIINNSWSCPTYEGCTEPNILREAVEAVRAAGILTVQSAGNSGSSGCASISTPAAIYDASFTVGATDAADQIASFSSRGPVLVDGSMRLKPDIVAPGVSVRSSYIDDGYAWRSGTSMAAPHVAGLAALLISANRDLAGDVDRLERIMTLTAVPKSATQDCSGFPGNQVPNAVFGYGRIDAVAAWRFAIGPRYLYPLILAQAPPAPSETPSEGR